MDNQLVGPCCVTGGTGFVASHLVKHLLSKNVMVHATVRNTNDNDKVAFLKALPNASTHLKLFNADLAKDGSFKEAITGCVGVFHVASPFPTEVKSFETDLRVPAVEGTLNVLKTAVAELSVQRVVLVSSVTAVYCPPVTKDKSTFTEADWDSKATETNFPYFLSKRLAEQAAWKFVEEANTRNPVRKISLVSVNPGMIFGPLLHKPALLNTSNSLVLGLLFGGDNGSGGFVDVDDVVEALSRAMSYRNANGRYLCSGASHTYTELTSMLAELYPDLVMAMEGGEQEQELVPVFSSEKIRKDLGINFTPIKDTLKKTIDSLKQKEFVPTF